jgi:hypothetical protein
VADVSIPREAAEGAAQIKHVDVHDRHKREARATVANAPVWRNASGGNPIEPRVIRAYYDITDGRCWQVEVVGDKVEEITAWRPYRRSSTRRLNDSTLHTAPEWVRAFVEAHRPEVRP